MQSLRDMSEWRRWEEANKWAWEGVRRRRWAEALWRRQNIRKIQLMEYAHNKARAEAKFKFEQENEARRRARFGASSQAQNPFSGKHEPSIEINLQENSKLSNFGCSWSHAAIIQPIGNAWHLLYQMSINLPSSKFGSTLKYAFKTE